MFYYPLVLHFSLRLPFYLHRFLHSFFMLTPLTHSPPVHVSIPIAPPPAQSFLLYTLCFHFTSVLQILLTSAVPSPQGSLLDPGFHRYSSKNTADWKLRTHTRESTCSGLNALNRHRIFQFHLLTIRCSAWEAQAWGLIGESLFFSPCWWVRV